MEASASQNPKPKPPVVETGDVGIKQTLQDLLTTKLPNYVPAVDSTIIDGGLVFTELAQTYIPPESFRYGQARTSIPIRLQSKCMLNCRIKVFRSFFFELDYEEGLQTFRHGPELEWTETEANVVDVYIICFIQRQSPEIYAIVPASHIHGGKKSGGLLVEKPLELPNPRRPPTQILTTFQPYIVREPELAPFLQNLVLHARNNGQTIIRNPTTGAMYNDFKPRLSDLKLLDPVDNDRQTVWALLRALHEGFEESPQMDLQMMHNHQLPYTMGADFDLGYRKNVRHIRHPVRFMIKAWNRMPATSFVFRSVRRTETSQREEQVFEYSATWHYLLAMSENGMEGLFIPRDCIPQDWWGQGRVDLSFVMRTSRWLDFVFPFSIKPSEVARKMEEILEEFGMPKTKVPAEKGTIEGRLGQPEPVKAQTGLRKQVDSNEFLRDIKETLYTHLHEECIRQNEIFPFHIIPLHEDHPRGDFMFTRYKEPLEDSDGGYNLRNTHSARLQLIPGDLPVLLLTVVPMASPPHGSLQVTEAAARQIQKSTEGSLLCILPIVRNESDGLEFKDWAIIPPSELKHGSLLNLLASAKDGALPSASKDTSFCLTSHPQTIEGFTVQKASIMQLLRGFFGITRDVQVGPVQLYRGEAMELKENVDQAWVDEFRSRNAPGVL